MEQILNPIHLACTADDFRPNFRLIEIKNGIAHASNGIILVKINLRENGQLTPEQVDLLEGKYIDMEVWKECHKCDFVDITEDHIICNKNGINKTFDFSIPQGTFFNMDGIVIQIADAGPEEKHIVAYNSKFIVILSKIFGSNELRFSFSKGHSGTLVYPNDYEGMFAVLMPIELQGAQKRYYFLT